MSEPGANPYLSVAPEVAEALAHGRPVVALESTIISHGFPYPANVECAMKAQQCVRDEGAVPATIAVLGGRITVGLDDAQIGHLATAGPERIAKASRRDLAVLAATGADGATTVAGTMYAAALAGIGVFATGGIGGVHRGAATTFDISADLLELARTSVCVVCAGAKSILDIGLTLEVLETHGVPVLGFRTSEFPAFYARTSGFGVDARFETAEQIARVLSARQALGLEGGTLVANSIDEAHAIEPDVLAGWTAQAMKRAASQGVHGKDVTPFLLAVLHEVSGGATEQANKELVYSNARLAAQIARAR